MNTRINIIIILIAHLAFYGNSFSSFASETIIRDDAEGISVIANESSRRTILNDLADFFDLCIQGEAVPDKRINGHHIGTLGELLKWLLPDYAYTIAYRDGAPRRLALVPQGSDGVSGVTILRPEQECSPSVGIEPSDREIG